MKQIITALLLLITASSFAQSAAADKLLGTYLTEDKNAKIKIEKKDGIYYGILVWSDTPDSLDRKNPDPALRNEVAIGHKIIDKIVYNNKKSIWNNGTVYDPRKGKVYKCRITRKEDGTLKLRGYIGIPLFGISTRLTITQ